MTSQKTYSPSKAHQWNRLVCDAIHFVALAPTTTTRALAIVHTAMYDAWTIYNNSGIEESTMTGNRLQKLEPECTSENREMAFSHAAYSTAHALFWCRLPPEHKNMFRDFMCDCGYDPDDTNLEIDNPAGIGNLSAKLVLECRAGDGSNPHATLHEGNFSDFSGYYPKNPPVPQPLKFPEKWQPQLQDMKTQQFLTAHWGLVKPFALSWGGQFRPPKPMGCDKGGYKKQADKVLKYSEGLTDTQKMIAEFWAGMHEDKFVDSTKDDRNNWATPAEQWCRIARYLSKKCGHKNVYDIKMFFVLSNALLDAGIAAWDAKVHYDYVRPISAIRDLYRGKTIQAWGGICQGVQELEGEDWIPYIPTPPFAEYVSGHSTFSAAAVEVLTSFCGTSVYGEWVTIPKGGSRIEIDTDCTLPSEDITLEWKHLKDAANQAGISRLYGGIHFVPGDLEGRELGSKVGCEVWEKATKYFNGLLG